jgi:hypothetical protein
MSGVSDARTWLKEKGYGDVADEIDAIMAKWRKRGGRTALPAPRQPSS